MSRCTTVELLKNTFRGLLRRSRTVKEFVLHVEWYANRDDTVPTFRPALILPSVCVAVTPQRSAHKRVYEFIEFLLYCPPTQGSNNCAEDPVPEPSCIENLRYAVSNRQNPCPSYIPQSGSSKPEGFIVGIVSHRNELP